MKFLCKCVRFCAILFYFLFGCNSAVEEVPIGISVWDSYSDVFKTMKYALEKHTNDSDKLFQFMLYADRYGFKQIVNSNKFWSQTF